MRAALAVTQKDDANLAWIHLDPHGEVWPDRGQAT